MLDVKSEISSVRMKLIRTPADVLVALTGLCQKKTVFVPFKLHQQINSGKVRRANDEKIYIFLKQTFWFWINFKSKIIFCTICRIWQLKRLISSFKLLELYLHFIQFLILFSAHMLMSLTLDEQKTSVFSINLFSEVPLTAVYQY